jgi:hypothetical protein
MFALSLLLEYEINLPYEQWSYRPERLRKEKGFDDCLLLFANEIEENEKRTGFTKEVRKFLRAARR